MKPKKGRGSMAFTHSTTPVALPIEIKDTRLIYYLPPNLSDPSPLSISLINVRKAFTPSIAPTMEFLLE